MRKRVLMNVLVSMGRYEVSSKKCKSCSKQNECKNVDLNNKKISSAHVM